MIVGIAVRELTRDSISTRYSLHASFSVSSSAQADFDGCYLMYKQVLKEKNPAARFCLSGIAEGEGARLTIHENNTRKVKKCDYATEIEIKISKSDFLAEKNKNIWAHRNIKINILKQLYYSYNNSSIK
jgi:hypothetical protein